MLIGFKDHEIRELVSVLTEAARLYAGCQCMRDVMSRIVTDTIRQKQWGGVMPYRVGYEGMWLGGEAIVLASSAEEAIELVRKDNKTCLFNHVTVEELPLSGVILNDNGDY